MSKRSIFGPVEQRVFGLVHIAQGIVMVVVGKRAPSWTLKYAIRGAKRHGRLGFPTAPADEGTVLEPKR